MKSDSLGSRADSTDSPTASPKWRPAEVDRSEDEVITAKENVVADGWSRVRISGNSDSARVVYRRSEAEREAIRRRLREVLYK